VEEATTDRNTRPLPGPVGAFAAAAQAAGLALRGLRREGDARELFRALGPERALAPDALLDLEDEQARATVRLRRARLGQPAAAEGEGGRLAAYAAGTAWTSCHPLYPCPLFLTTTDARALAFLKALADLVTKAERERGGRSWASWLTAGACAMAHAPEQALRRRAGTTSGRPAAALPCLSCCKRPGRRSTKPGHAMRRNGVRASSGSTGCAPTCRAQDTRSTPQISLTRQPRPTSGLRPANVC
jgi:hypothetical protein